MTDSTSAIPEPLPAWPSGLLICLDLLLASFIFGVFWELLSVLKENLGYKILFYALWLLVPPLNAMWLLWRLIFVIRDAARGDAREPRTWKTTNPSRVLLNRLGGHALILCLPSLLPWAAIIGRGWEVMPPDATFRFVWEALTYSAATFVCLAIALIGSLRLLERTCTGSWSWFASMSAFSIWSAWSALAFYGIAVTLVPVWLLAKWQLWLGYLAASVILLPSCLAVTLRLLARWHSAAACYPKK